MVDDKGATLIATVGLPEQTDTDPLRAVRAALQVEENLSGMSPPLKPSIGITSSVVFVGKIGNPIRREMAVLGDRVNLAARLMAAASKKKFGVGGVAGVLCDVATYTAVSSRLGQLAASVLGNDGGEEATAGGMVSGSDITFMHLGEISVKGKTEAITIYRPFRAAETGAFGKVASFTVHPLVATLESGADFDGSESCAATFYKQLKVFEQGGGDDDGAVAAEGRSAMGGGSATPPHASMVTVIHGARGGGKSTTLHTIHVPFNSCRVLRFDISHSMAGVPFALWRAVFATIFGCPLRTIDPKVRMSAAELSSQELSHTTRRALQASRDSTERIADFMRKSDDAAWLEQAWELNQILGTEFRRPKASKAGKTGTTGDAKGSGGGGGGGGVGGSGDGDGGGGGRANSNEGITTEDAHKVGTKLQRLTKKLSMKQSFRSARDLSLWAYAEEEDRKNTPRTPKTTLGLRGRGFTRGESKRSGSPGEGTQGKDEGGGEGNGGGGGKTEDAEDRGGADAAEQYGGAFEPAVTDEDTRFRLVLTLLARLVEAVAARFPLMIAVDDADFSHESTCLALISILRGRDAPGMIFLLTVSDLRSEVIRTILTRPRSQLVKVRGLTGHEIDKHIMYVSFFEGLNQLYYPMDITSSSIFLWYQYTCQHACNNLTWRVYTLHFSPHPVINFTARTCSSALRGAARAR